MIEIDPKNTPTADIYKLLIGAVVPRPIAFVSTVSKNGIGNLAPFSFFNAVSSNPPCLIISVGRHPDGSKKDTLINIEETQEFVINSVNLWFREKMVETAARYPYGVDEMAKVGLTALPSKLVLPPRVAEAAVQFECLVEKLVELGDGSAGSATLVIGKIALIHISNEVYEDGKIKFEALKPVARLSGTTYGSVSDIQSIPVPKIKS